MKIFQKIKSFYYKENIFTDCFINWCIFCSESAGDKKNWKNAYANYVYEAKRDLLNSSMAGIEDKLAAYENGTYQFITNDRIQVYASALKEAYDILAEMEGRRCRKALVKICL